MKIASQIAMLLLALLAAFVVGFLAGTAPEHVSKSPPAPASFSATPSIRVISVTCDPNYGRPRADIAIQAGSEPINAPVAFVSFGRAVYSAHFQPVNIPARAMATATLYGKAGDSPSCELTSVQDKDGGRVNRI